MNQPSISSQMQKGNARKLAQIRALLKDHSPKVNNKFCPATLNFDTNQASAEKTRRISKASI